MINKCYLYLSSWPIDPLNSLKALAHCFIKLSLNIQKATHIHRFSSLIHKILPQHTKVGTENAFPKIIFIV